MGVELDKEHISALFDDELPYELAREKWCSASVRERWSLYALISAALQGNPCSDPRDGFVERVLEATGMPCKEQPQEFSPSAAANDAVWGWGAVAAVLILALTLGLVVNGSVPSVRVASPHEERMVATPARVAAWPQGRANAYYLWTHTPQSSSQPTAIRQVVGYGAERKRER